MTNTPPLPSPTDVVIEPDNEVWNPAPADDLVAEIIGKVPKTYAALKLELADAVICYGEPGGCVREEGCEESCLMLATYKAGVLFAAKEAATRIQSDAEKIGTLEAQVKTLRERGDHWARVAGATNAQLGMTLETLNHVADMTFCGADAEWHFKQGYDPQTVMDVLAALGGDHG